MVGVADGAMLGGCDGTIEDGWPLGTSVGIGVGRTDGASVGASDGTALGGLVGSWEGPDDGWFVGASSRVRFGSSCACCGGSTTKATVRRCMTHSQGDALQSPMMTIEPIIHVFGNHRRSSVVVSHYRMMGACSREGRPHTEISMAQTLAWTIDILAITGLCCHALAVQQCSMPSTAW